MELSNHINTRADTRQFDINPIQTYQCAICEFCADTQKVVEQHIAAEHIKADNTSTNADHLATHVEDPVTDANYEDGEDKGYKFNTTSTKLLISLMAAHADDFDAPLLTHKSVFERIAATMTSAGFELTWRHTRGKWYGLKRTYNSILDNKSSNNRRRWPFMSDMAKIMNTRIPSTRAIASCNMASMSPTESGSSGGACTPFSSSRTEHRIHRKRKKPSADADLDWDKQEQQKESRKTRHEDRKSERLLRHRERMEEKRQRMEERIKLSAQRSQRHEENLKEKRRFNDLFEQLLNKN